MAMKPRLIVEVPLVVRSGDTALLYSKWTLTGTGPDGSAVDMAGQGTEVVRRQGDGTWRYLIDHVLGLERG